MITLYQFSRCWNLPNASTFCMKLETYLRMANIPYEIKFVNDPRKAPKGKLPYINHNGHIIADSGLIIDELKKQMGDTLDTHLSAEQKAIALAFTRLCDEHLCWVIVYARWIEPKGWNIIEPLFFSHLPKWKRALISPLMQRYMKKQLHNHGLGRHSAQEVHQMGIDDIKAIAVYLNDKPYFFGEEPSSIDSCIYSYLTNIANTPIPSPVKEALHTHSHLLAYCQRMQKRYFPEFVPVS